MNIRKAIVAASASALLVSGAPVANAQIVAPEPSSRIDIPPSFVDFAQPFSPLSRYETEQVMKIGAAWLLISAALSIGSAIVVTTLNILGNSLTLSQAPRPDLSQAPRPDLSQIPRPDLPQSS
ncbi:hypothetical protein [Corynebacterium mayonis]|uniref:hypothetical protein n=1 Tax=Corynebacterium mayonis TaxID=3062461 RepID=UPI00313FF5A8